MKPNINDLEYNKFDSEGKVKITGSITTDVETGLAKSVNQLPDNHQVTVSNFPTQDEWVSGLGIDTEDVTNYYFGFIKVGGDDWRIQRMNKSTYAISWASGATDASTNWANRTTLTYGDGL
jgi:hypothetical protein